MDKVLLEEFKGKGKEVPIWLMRQAGRYLPEYREVRKEANGFLGMCYNASIAAEITLQPLRRFDLDAAIIFSDILVIPDALGQKVEFKEEIGPVLKSLEVEMVDLGFGSFAGKLEPVYKAIEIVKQQIGKRTLIGFSGAPFTLLCYMIEGQSSKGFEKTKRFLYAQPDKAAEIVEILIEAISLHLMNQIRAGCEAVQIFDSWAGVLCPEDFKVYVTKPIKRIVEKLREKYPKVPVICFPKGGALMYESFIRDVKPDGLSLDSQVTSDWVLDKVPQEVVVQGNLDPSLLEMGGELMLERAEKILKNYSNRKFIFNLGHGVIKTTSPEEVARLVNFVKAYRRG